MGTKAADLIGQCGAKPLSFRPSCLTQPSLCFPLSGWLTLRLLRFQHPASSVGLTDYEIRDLNDEINKLLREKNHWENQIIALGGANYKRGIRSMVDDSGREIPGTRGYK